MVGPSESTPGRWRAYEGQSLNSACAALSTLALMPRQILIECRRLLSVRGEANSPVLAAAIVAKLEALSEPERSRFFERLSSDFSPDPKAVLAAAQAYAADAERAQPDRH